MLLAVLRRCTDILRRAAAEQLAQAGRSIDMIASRSATAPSRTRVLVDAEAAFRDALIESFDRLELCDRNMLRFHYFHGLTVDQLAEMFCSPRTAVVRQLARIRERLLRETRRGLAARLALDKHELDRLLDIARGRFDHALTRILRT